MSSLAVVLQKQHALIKRTGARYQQFIKQQLEKYTENTTKL
jgi:hypothetical protein